MLRRFYHLTINQFKAFNASKKSKKRASLLAIFLGISFVAVFFILKFLNENILYFKSPTDIKQAKILILKKNKVGGMVKKNTLKINEKEIKFIITDFKNEIKVSFSGSVPNLFAEGKGVVQKVNYKIKNFL